MSDLLARYHGLIASGELQTDPDQLSAIEVLDRLQHECEEHANAANRSWIAQIFGKSEISSGGVYLWGGVGRGKSMLMDLFYDGLDVARKRRAHFHAFMLEVHQRIREERKIHAGDPIAPLAAALAQEVDCLAFDEMVINNSADAMIMGRLFGALITDHNVIIVTTSNRPPHDLYKDGLNREHFLPFIQLIEERLDIVRLDGPLDYRLDRLAGLASWHTPLGDAATSQVREAFFRLTDFNPEDAEHVPSREIDLGGGRMLHVPKALKGVAVFSFKRLCKEARGASDYLAIAQLFHTIIIVGIPQMGPDMRNEAARFVTLIDALYENNVKLFAAAAVTPDDLYRLGDGSFEFERTISRLTEMQSAQYMAKGHGIEV